MRALDKPGALKALRRHMQMIFQDPYASLDPRQTVGQAIAEPMLVHGIADAREAARSRRAALREGRAWSPAMARRCRTSSPAASASASPSPARWRLAPKLIVADEAVSALDVSVKAQILNLMLDLQAELGLAYLFISHDMAVVERISHRIAVMYLGEIVEIGPRARDHREPAASLHAAPAARRAGSRSAAAGRARRRLGAGELPSPIRAPDYQPAAARLAHASRTAISFRRRHDAPTTPPSSIAT